MIAEAKERVAEFASEVLVGEGNELLRALRMAELVS